ncbi:hypothetical protein NHN26_16480 [Rhodovulum tesquicola]|nr:hypothetical protein [Rhodovulum tesquicola]MCO8146806.1 hypothetical protein [Rhodovulum tesquicola]
MAEIPENGPADVVHTASSEVFFRRIVRGYPRGADMRDIAMTDPHARDRP